MHTVQRHASIINTHAHKLKTNLQKKKKQERRTYPAAKTLPSVEKAQQRPLLKGATCTGQSSSILQNLTILEGKQVMELKVRKQCFCVESHSINTQITWDHGDFGWDRLLCNPGWHHAPDLPAFTSQELGLQGLHPANSKFLLLEYGFIT